MESGKKFFKIKWAGFSSDENTWECEGSVPGFIQKFYEDENNLGGYKTGSLKLFWGFHLPPIVFDGGILS